MGCWYVRNLGLGLLARFSCAPVMRPGYGNVRGDACVRCCRPGSQQPLSDLRWTALGHPTLHFAPSLGLASLFLSVLLELLLGLPGT